MKTSGAAHPGRAPLPGTLLNPGQRPPWMVLAPVLVPVLTSA